MQKLSTISSNILCSGVCTFIDIYLKYEIVLLYILEIYIYIYIYIYINWNYKQLSGLYPGVTLCLLLVQNSLYIYHQKNFNNGNLFFVSNFLDLNNYFNNLHLGDLLNWIQQTISFCQNSNCHIFLVLM